MIPVSSQLLNGTARVMMVRNKGGYNTQPPIYHFQYSISVIL